MRKILFFIFFATVFVGNIFANSNVSFSLEITGIKINEGSIHVKIYSNESDYKKDIPYASFTLKSVAQSIMHSFEILKGEYLIAIFQDTNNNGILDTNLFGFPKEPVGLSNYTGGIPGGFNKQKILISNASNKVTINVGKV